MPDNSNDDFEFWRLDTVERKTGLGKSTIYQRMSERDPRRNPFPQSKAYVGAGDESRAGRFWISGEVRAWQRREAGFDPLQGETPAGVAGLLG